METSVYQEVAEGFLTKHNISMKAKFIKNDLYFHTDKETRDIFRVTFTREGKKFSIKFGQCITDSTYTGSKPPTAYDVLACITKYDPSDFDNFCSNFGYPPDSITALKVYKSVVKEWAKVSAFFTKQELGEMQEIN